MTHPDRIKSLSRWRVGLAIAAVALPLALFTLFERQARRLDALATEGAVVQARVTRASRGTTHYAYRVSGVDYTWSVRRSDAPYATGESFAATYLPSDPALSRPFAERGLAATESARNRSFTWKIVLGLGLSLGFFALLTHRALQRLRRGAPSETANPAAYRQRLTLTGVALLPLLALITGFHAQDALEKGQSIVPVVLSVVLVLALLGGVYFVVARKGPGEARTRAATLMRWILPLAIGVALLRLVALAFGR